MLESALRHIICEIVDYPEAVHIKTYSLVKAVVFKVTVHPEDAGRVIGRSGRTIKAAHTVLSALADGTRVRIDLAE